MSLSTLQGKWSRYKKLFLLIFLFPNHWKHRFNVPPWRPPSTDRANLPLLRGSTRGSPGPELLGCESSGGGEWYHNLPLRILVKVDDQGRVPMQENSSRGLFHKIIHLFIKKITTYKSTYRGSLLRWPWLDSKLWGPCESTKEFFFLPVLFPGNDYRFSSTSLRVVSHWVISW